MSKIHVARRHFFFFKICTDFSKMIRQRRRSIRRLLDLKYVSRYPKLIDRWCQFFRDALLCIKPVLYRYSRCVQTSAWWVPTMRRLVLIFGRDLHRCDVFVARPYDRRQDPNGITPNHKMNGLDPRPLTCIRRDKFWNLPKWPWIPRAHKPDRIMANIYETGVSLILRELYHRAWTNCSVRRRTRCVDPFVGLSSEPYFFWQFYCSRKSRNVPGWAFLEKEGL